MIDPIKLADALEYEADQILIDAGFRPPRDWPIDKRWRSEPHHSDESDRLYATRDALLAVARILRKVAM